MRRLVWLAALTASLPVAAQEQQALVPPAAAPQAIYDIVAADRETAWRINRQTGEVTVCRVDTAASLDGVRARCAPAIQDGAPQQSQSGQSQPGGIQRP